jgi:peroxiredoxin
MSRPASWWAVVAVALIALAAGAGVAWQRLAPTLTRGSAQPFFERSFNDLDGSAQAMSQWKGRIVVVNFWATWCPPCIEEMPDLQRVHDEYRARGVTVVGLGIDNPSALRRFRDDNGLSLPLYAAGAGGSELARALGDQSGGLPFTVLISRDGRIVHVQLGQIRPTELKRLLDAQVGTKAG